MNGILYAAAGGNVAATNTVEAYDPATDNWTTKAPMLVARDSADGGVVNGILYAVGGVTPSVLVVTDEAYDPACNTWTAIAPMPTRRYGLSGRGVNNVLYALGGRNDSGELATNEAFTPSPPYAAQVQQPINPNGSSVFNVMRGVVPVKFTLTLGGVATCQLPPATISLVRTGGAAPGSIDESIYIQASESGSTFRIDTSNCQYIYNLNAQSLGAGTYVVSISIGGSVVGSGTFGLK